MRIILNAQNKVLMVGPRPSAEVGQTAVDLDDTQAAQFAAVAASAPWGMTFDGSSFTALPQPAPTAAEIAYAADAAERAAAKADSQIQAFLAQTNAQRNADINTAFPDNAQAAIVRKLSRIVAAIAKQQL